MLKLPRTIRLDPSDTFVFDRAAEPGEWAVSGAFVFWDVDADSLGPKQRTALRAGFLGLSSFGWSTLCVVSPATEAERDAATAALADKLLADFGAPSREAAMAAAAEEIAFAAALCDHPENTLLAVQRQVEDGQIRERFRTLHARDPAVRGDALHAHARAFQFVEAEDEPAEEIDLAGLMKTGRT